MTKKLSIYKPEPYQLFAEKQILNHRTYALFLRMGLGKTVATLTALYKLMFDYMRIGRTLVIAPKRVAQTVWLEEAAKWAHLQKPPLKIGIAVGTAKERTAVLNGNYDIVCINVDVVSWLANNYPDRFDCLVIDEASKFKSHATHRFKALKTLLPYFARRYILTGTPAPRGYVNLWSEMYLLDGGARLGKNITAFRNSYCMQDYSGFNWYVPEAMQSAVKTKIQDISFGLDNNAVRVPYRINDIKCTMDKNTAALYKSFKKNSVLEMIDNIPDTENNHDYKLAFRAEQMDASAKLANDKKYCEFKHKVIAKTAAVLSNKLLQFASGAIYYDGKNYSELHHIKMDALKDIIDEAQGENILIAYNYQHELLRIKKEFPQAKQLLSPADLNNWNAGKIAIAVCQPQSVGHGLNIQQGGHIIVWFSPTFDLEVYDQFNARLARKGQQFDVVIHRLLLAGTRDMECVRALEQKGYSQTQLIQSLSAELNLKGV